MVLAMDVYNLKRIFCFLIYFPPLKLCSRSCANYVQHKSTLDLTRDMLVVGGQHTKVKLLRCQTQNDCTWQPADEVHIPDIENAG